MTEVHAPVLDTLVRMNEVALERSGATPRHSRSCGSPLATAIATEPE
jgi:hypothetical protein